MNYNDNTSDNLLTWVDKTIMHQCYSEHLSSTTPEEEGHQTDCSFHVKREFPGHINVSGTKYVWQKTHQIYNTSCYIAF